MRKFRLLLAALMCLPSVLSAHAASPMLKVTTTDEKIVTIELTDGMRSSFWTLKDHPETPCMLSVYTGNVTNDETGRLVTGERDEDFGLEEGKILLELPVPDVQKLTFVDVVSVDEIFERERINIDVENGKLLVTGLTSPAELSVYSLAGVLEENITLTGDSEISINRFGTGMHLVKIGNTAFKILVR